MRSSLKRTTKSIYLKQIIPTLKCSTFVAIGSRLQNENEFVELCELIFFTQTEREVYAADDDIQNKYKPLYKVKLMGDGWF